jgi:lysophospholipase L1-like esterase
VAIGGSDARGIGTDDPLREAWPQDLFRALPANYRLVNLAIPNATVADAVAESLPTAETLHPTLVTVWLGINDILSQVPVTAFQGGLTTLIHALRATGATVLVGNEPPVDLLPGYLACVSVGQGTCAASIPQPAPARAEVAAAVTAYNAAIAAVAAREGAVVIDLHAAAGAAGTQTSRLADDGFNPSAAGAQMIANLFAAAEKP